MPMTEEPTAECSLCHREHSLLSMVRVICALERLEEDFCDWDCMALFFAWQALND